jgi:methyl-accepting chemotaxis protein
MRRIIISTIILLVILAVIGTAVYEGLNKYLILSIISFGGFLYVIANWFVYRSFLEGIRKGVGFATSVSQGDLTRKIYIMSQDEVGQLSESLNQMAVNLSFMINQVKLSIVELSGLIQQNYRISEALNRTFGLQTGSFNDMSLSIKALDDSIRHVSENIEGVVTLTETAYGNANSGKALLGRMLREMDEIKKSSEKVYAILGIMNGITEKTRLLALNASLVSGKSGGPSTASLAPEIRKLAESTGDSTREIEKIVKGNLEVSFKASDTADEVNKAFNQVRNDVEEIVHITEDIKASVNEEKKESGQIIIHKNRVGEMAGENIRQVNELADFTNTLSRQVETLRSLISRFVMGGE